MDCSPPGSSVHGMFQARILEWVAIFFSREYSQPRDWTHILYWKVDMKQFLPKAALCWEAGRWSSDKCRHTVWYFSSSTYLLKKTRPGEFEWFVQEGFAVWLLREACAPGYPASQTNTLSTSDTSAFCWTFPALYSWLSWEEQIWLSLCQNQGDGFSLLLYIFTSFKVRTACITYLVGILVVPVVMFSQAHLCAGLGLQEGLEPGTWLEPLGWTRDLDLGYIPILIPKRYWKEYRLCPGWLSTYFKTCNVYLLQ